MIKVRNWLKPVNFLQFYFRICSNARQDLFSSHKMPKNVQWPKGGDCAFHAFLTLFGTVLRTSCPDGHRTPAGYRPYRSFFSSWEIYGGEGEIRTPGTDKRYNRFRVCRIRPLCHLSINIFRQVKGLTPSEICCSGYAVQQVRTSR